MKCPCESCTKQGCGSYHDICEKYKKWQAWKAEQNAKRNAKYDAEYTSHPNKEQAFRKKMKWK